MHHHWLRAAALLFFAAGAAAQTCAESNSNAPNNCGLGALPQDGTTVYYAPTDSGNIEIFAQSDGACASGSQATVTFYTGFDLGSGTQLASCGCLPLDGSTYVLDCGIPKATIPEGGYHFVIEVNGAYTGYVRFNIVHEQQTVTAATPTSTATSTTYESTTVTTTSTNTNTATSAQISVTSPAGTTDVTATSTPAEVTATTTLTATITKHRTVWTETVVTYTITAPCQRPSRCPIVQQKQVHRLDHRQENGYTVTGDGPPTTTVTPSPTITTTTVDGGTTTDTATAYTTTTTTVQPTPLTTTIYSGTATASFTVTLPTQTTTVTAHTSTKVTVTRTWTFTWYQPARVTPYCPAKYIPHH